MSTSLTVETHRISTNASLTSRTKTVVGWNQWPSRISALREIVLGLGSVPISLVRCLLPFSSLIYDTNSSTTDESSDIEDKFIRKVRVRLEECIVALSMDYTDGSSTAWSGGSRGKVEEFVLEDNEDIIQVWYIADHQRIRALRFGTSKGRYLINLRESC